MNNTNSEFSSAMFVNMETGEELLKINPIPVEKINVNTEGKLELVMMDETLQEYFQKLDDYLRELGQSDSTIEYAPHAKIPFEMVVTSLNKIKVYLGGEYKSVNYYFDKED